MKKCDLSFTKERLQDELDQAIAATTPTDDVCTHH